MNHIGCSTASFSPAGNSLLTKSNNVTRDILISKSSPASMQYKTRQAQKLNIKGIGFGGGLRVYHS